MKHPAPTTPPIGPDQAAPVRLRLRVSGVVQGVGFRPRVYQLATELGLSGWVRNTARGVEIDIQGGVQIIDAFQQRLQHDPPPHWSIQGIHLDRLALQAEEGFVIRDSAPAIGCVSCSIPPDLATCDACRREVFDPTDRRFRYPFTNCTACGPRYSILTALPYDRSRTTMQIFEMCAMCQAEYNDPHSRRFHAQPNACPTCGPQLALMTMDGRVGSRRSAALIAACCAIRAGKIVAVKGLGGYHLMVDARQEDAINTLRERKHRPAKPFAIMVPNLEHARALCEMSDVERRTLCSPQSPIVLMRRRTDTSGFAQAIAPGNPYLGVMLPYTPLHHLMLDLLDAPVIATSGNLSDEPICIDATEAMQRLSTIADLMLTHDRPIARPIDDSIVQVITEEPRVLRRARGYAPQHIKLPMYENTRTILAVGAQQKAAVGLLVNGDAILSQHIGDLSSPEALTAHRNAIDDLQHLLRAKPIRVAADLHPDYQSTRYAHTLGLALSSIQHHAAHVYAAMAEHAISPETPVLGAAWDGTGLGTDGTIWGGELLRVHGNHIERVGHLEPFLLPGGDAAARQPWRSALGVLFATFGDDAFEMDDLPPIASIPQTDRPLLRQMLHAGTNTPTSTSAGRLFDAVAALLGLHQSCSFEGQAAMSLQFAAESVPSEHTPLRMTVRGAQPLALDWRPVIRSIVTRIREGEPANTIARAFHMALAQGLAQLISRLAEPNGQTVVLTGGCFQNKLLTELCVAALRKQGIQPTLHRNVPPNDGGLALGQLYAAALDATPNREGGD